MIKFLKCIWYIIIEASGSIDIDWNFLDNMHKCRDNKLSIITNEDRINFQPDIDVLKDAVVTPWYRNQEQPQVLSKQFL